MLEESTKAAAEAPIPVRATALAATGLHRVQNQASDEENASANAIQPGIPNEQEMHELDEEVAQTKRHTKPRRDFYGPGGTVRTVTVISGGLLPPFLQKGDPPFRLLTRPRHHAEGRRASRSPGCRSRGRAPLRVLLAPRRIVNAPLPPVDLEPVAPIALADLVAGRRAARQRGSWRAGRICTLPGSLSYPHLTRYADMRAMY